jgi:hypothetical protein
MFFPWGNVEKLLSEKVSFSNKKLNHLTISIHFEFKGYVAAYPKSGARVCAPIGYISRPVANVIKLFTDVSYDFS